MTDLLGSDDESDDDEEGSGSDDDDDDSDSQDEEGKPIITVDSSCCVWNYTLNCYEQSLFNPHNFK